MMSGILLPDEVRGQFAFQDIMRLRKDYLTLWDRVKELENIVGNLREQRDDWGRLKSVEES